MTIRLPALATVALVTLAACGSSNQPATPATGTTAAQEASAMQLTSSAFVGGDTLPSEYTCDGAGHSPPLAWSDPPAKTQSFALTVEDPDAPKGTFRHWGVYDIPASTRELPGDVKPTGSAGFKQTNNDFGKAGYGPPCPPKGDQSHRYEFRLLALDVGQLPGSPASVKDLLDATNGHVLGSAELLGFYGRG